MDIETYNHKRNFSKTSEPEGRISKAKGRRFVIQEHFASRHHFDFRLELGGVLKSWAVPKGPSLNPKDKRLAVHVEDHPIEYGGFEGIIPKGEYGGGKVVLWDVGEWLADESPMEAYKRGKLEFELKGSKLQGRWALVKTKLDPGAKQENWLLMKKNDQHANPESDIVKERPESVKALKEKVEPLELSPQLATLSSKVPAQSNYIHEVKFDGYRTLAKLQNGQARLFTRNMKDWTHRYPLIARALMTEKYSDAIVDGEIVWLDENGKSSFEGLQNALKSADYERMYFYVFDVLELNGESVKNLPQEIRKGLAKQFVEDLADERILYSEHFSEPGKEVLANCCELGLEGIISKDASAPYQEGRNWNWQKIKCENRDEFTILGYVPRKDATQEIGALILGLYETKGFIEVGKVGTGFNQNQRRELYHKLEPLKTKEPQAKTSLKAKDIVWVEPKLLAEVKYTEVTSSQKLRHPVYVELREDKEAEQAALPAKIGPSLGEKELLDTITSPNKIIYPKEKITKFDLAGYYNEIYPFMASHINNKILTLVKCPQGAQGKCFYNKHAGTMKNVNSVEIQEKTKKENYIYINSLKSLLYLVRYNALEIHTWNTRAPDLENPDELIFDLDPAEDVASSAVIESSFELKEILEKLGFESFPKITGGKGIHLHIPLIRKYSVDDVYQLAKSVAFILEEEMPQKYTTNMRLKERGGRIFVDYLRNAFGASYICPFSLRKKENAPLSLPVTWDFLKSYDLRDPVTLKDFNPKTFKHPWPGYWEKAHKINLFEVEKKEGAAPAP